MIKKILLIITLVLIVIVIIFTSNKENIYNRIKDHPTLYNFLNKRITVANKLKANTVKESIGKELNITVNVSKTIGMFKKFYNGIGMSTFNEGVLKPYNNAFFKLVADENKKHQSINYVNMKSIFKDATSTKWNRDDGAYVFHRDKLGNVNYNWQIVNKVLDELVECGFKPIISFTFMPNELASDPNRVNPWHKAIISPPKDYFEWRELIYQTIKHLKERYGLSEIRTWYFEVWNEPDLYQYFWMPHPEEKRYSKLSDHEEYCKLYDYTVDGAVAVDANINIGGPGLAGDKRFLREFLKHCFTGKNYVTGEMGSRVDFISRHNYGEIEQRIIPQYKDFIDEIKSISGNSFNELEILITETGPSAAPAPWLNDRYVAAWIVKEVDAFLHLSDQYGTDYLPDLICFWSKPVSRIFGNQFGLVTALGNKHIPSPEMIIKRPAFNGYKTVSMLGNERIELTGVSFGDPIHGIATKSNDSSIEIILYHLEEGDVYNKLKNEYKINLEIIDCDQPMYSVEYYGINEIFSNGFNIWKSIGSPQFPSSEQLSELQTKDDLELIEPVSKLKVNHGIFTKQISIQNNSVVLLRLLTSNN